MKRTIQFLFVMLPAILAAVPAIAGSVHGTVRDAETLDPVAGASVTLHVINPDSLALPTTSGADGSYEITGIPAGNETYVLVAWKSGYALFYMTLPNAGAGDQQIDILLAVEEPPPPPGDPPPDSSAVSGQVLTGGSLAPIPGAVVTLESGGEHYVAFTDAQGRYQMHVLITTYSVTVEAAGFNTLTDSNVPAEAGGLTYNAVLTGTADVPPPLGYGVELRGADPNPFQGETTIRFTLSRSGRVTLRLYDLLGREVRTLLDGWRPAGSASVRLAAGDLPSGTYYLWLRMKGGMATRAVTVLR